MSLSVKNMLGGGSAVKVLNGVLGMFKTAYGAVSLKAYTFIDRISNILLSAYTSPWTGGSDGSYQPENKQWEYCYGYRGVKKLSSSSFVCLFGGYSEWYAGYTGAGTFSASSCTFGPLYLTYQNDINASNSYDLIRVSDNMACSRVLDVTIKYVFQLFKFSGTTASISSLTIQSLPSGSNAGYTNIGAQLIKINDSLYLYTIFYKYEEWEIIYYGYYSVISISSDGTVSASKLASLGNSSSKLLYYVYTFYNDKFLLLNGTSLYVYTATSSSVASTGRYAAFSGSIIDTFGIDSNRVLILYKDSSNNVMLVIGTDNGSTFTLGASLTVTNSSSVDNKCIYKIDTAHFIITVGVNIVLIEVNNNVITVTESQNLGVSCDEILDWDSNNSIITVVVPNGATKFFIRRYNIGTYIKAAEGDTAEGILISDASSTKAGNVYTRT